MLALTARSGEFAIPKDENATDIEAYSHVDVLARGAVPEKFRIYFTGKRARCLSVRIYKQLKASVTKT